MEKYEHEIFASCDALHGSATGAADPLTDEATRRLCFFLELRLELWHPRYQSEGYDNAVKALVEETLKEQIAAGLWVKHGS